MYTRLLAPVTVDEIAQSGNRLVSPMDAKIQKWKSLPATLTEFVCAVPLAAIECKALAGILPEQCPRIEKIQVSAKCDASRKLL